MSDINNIDSEFIFQKLSEILDIEEKEEKKKEEKGEKLRFFTQEELKLMFEKRIRADLIKIKQTSNSKSLQAHCSAALKHYKRDLITLHINKIKHEEGLKLTTRAADLFFMSYLGRSVGEGYLCLNFSGDYKKDIILTPDYKKKLNGIILKYKEECQDDLYLVISIYRRLKNSIIYA
ncbi:hypothetical protein AB7321_20370 [Providencia rettgeri]